MLKEECGIFGVFGHEDAAKLTYLGLYALQHRGQESAGITTFDHTRFRTIKEMGLVSEIFYLSLERRICQMLLLKL